MKLLLIFAAAIACAHALQLQYIVQGSGESSEEEYSLVLPSSGKPAFAVLDKPKEEDSDEESSEKEYRLLLPTVGQHQPSLSGVPIFQTVKVKVPRHGDSSIKQQLFAQALAARGISLQDLGVDPLTSRRSEPNLGIQNLGAQLLARSAGLNYGGQDYGAQLMARLVPNLGVQDLGAKILTRSAAPNNGGQDYGAQLMAMLAPNLGVQDLGAKLLTRSAAPNNGGQDYDAQLMAMLAPNLGVQDLGAQLLARSQGSNNGGQYNGAQLIQHSMPDLGQSQVYLIRKQRQAPASDKNVGEVVAEGGNVDSVIASNAVTEAPVIGVVTKPPIVDAVVAPIVSAVRQVRRSAKSN
ncbi:PREDICTED: uncharacterized protein LOC108363911 isoform X2 [Rhagoletis zephyria]|uniref:uncharacterized protein LOC108363911 isoform X2 n=1 Tax=Rhagoletis zephyria TaxID=28612 RepID=UPI0008113E68|nr:PREDICTED: uncharacterized protein LOC108363911 isoform X2 [Rhagoletis zephyria]